MKRSRVGLFGFFALAVALVAGACDSGGDSGAAAGTYASALESCSAYCEAYFAAACTPTFPTDGHCKIDMCSPIPATASAGCYTATKRWYDCLKAQSDVCGASGCTDQEVTVAEFCQ